MLRYLFISAWRNLTKNKLHTFINVAGLTLGLSCAIVAYLVLDFEFSFDKHQKNYDRIYRVTSEIDFSGNPFPNPGIPIPLADHLMESYPEIAAGARMSDHRITVIPEGKTKEDDLKIERPVFTNTAIFEVLTWAWVSGSPETALENPRGIVLTQKEVERLFPNEDPLGKTLQMNDSTFLEVTGVVENPPQTSSFGFSAMASYEIIRKDKERNAQLTNVGSSDQFIFVLEEGTSASELEEKINNYFYEQTKDSEDDNTSWKFILQPLSDFHFNKDYAGMTAPAANMQTLKAVVVIGIFLLIIGCINYINLATAIATNRAREVGIRKTLGSSRAAIMRHYLMETSLLITISVFCSFALAELFLVKLDMFMNLKIEGSLLQNALLGEVDFYLFVLILIGVMTLLAGAYPSLILSGYQPVEALKSKLGNQRKTGMLALRRGLVVFQFGISQVLVLGALVVFTQLQFSKNKDLGFESDAVLSIDLPWSYKNNQYSKFEAYKNRLAGIDGVYKTALSSTPPISLSRSTQLGEYPTPNGPKNIMVDVKMADRDWFDLYGFGFLAGGPYRALDSADQAVINETLLRNMGLENPEDAIGLRIGDEEEAADKTEIVGVVSDFHTASLHNAIAPVMIYPKKDIYSNLEMSIDRNKSEKVIAAAESIWKEIFPDKAINHFFVEDNLQKFYRNEERMLRLFNLFAGIAGFICCLGLYGLVSFMAVQKTKEIGIRKVLGAHIGNILYLFFKEFMRLIAIALFIALPLGYLVMNKWLEETFAYRIEIGPQIILTTMAGVILVAVLTIGYQSIKAATANPANALRSE